MCDDIVCMSQKRTPRLRKTEAETMPIRLIISSHLISYQASVVYVSKYHADKANVSRSSPAQCQYNTTKVMQDVHTRLAQGQKSERKASSKYISISMDVQLYRDDECET